MIDDLDLHNKEYNADICIVGGGVAGICLAKALEESGLNILLLEAGGLVYNKKKQALYSGDVVNPEKHPSLDKYRYRQFGGTSSYWGGRCVEYDNTDFSIKSDDGELLWPIGYGEIKKYYNSARQFLDSSLPALCRIKSISCCRKCLFTVRPVLFFVHCSLTEHRSQIFFWSGTINALSFFM